MRRTAPALLLLVALFAGHGAAPAQAGAKALARLVAPPNACPSGASVASQEAAMRCMVNFARRRAGLRPLSNPTPLDRSAAHKAGDILRCDSFSHFACGRDFTYWMRRAGYIPARCWRVGENLALGSGATGSARSAFSALIHSPPHRENILGHYSGVGIGLRVGTLAGHRREHVWTQHFGSHCGPRRLARLSPGHLAT